MVSSITGLNQHQNRQDRQPPLPQLSPPLPLVVTRWVTTSPERLTRALARLAEAHPALVAEPGIRLDRQADSGDTRSFRAYIQGKGRARRTEAVNLDVARWSPETAEIIVRPPMKRWKRSWSRRREAGYFRAADAVADAMAAVLRGGQPARRAAPNATSVWPRLHSLASGSRIWVRPLRPDDRDSYLRGVDSLSPTTMALRFGRPKSGLRDDEIDAFLDNGHHGREALAATTANGRTIIGIARLAPAPGSPDTAEVAIVVTDAWQGRGVGHLLMADLKECAARAGYRRLYATSSIDNNAVAALLRRHGFRTTAASLGVAEWSADLTESDT
jgi:RimJ/RimL family protein N-acetyltransferase